MSESSEINYSRIEFVKSVYKLEQLPEAKLPEIAFAGRSNVGKSSLMNRLINRKNFVKVSAKPGKTQSLNFFLVDNSLYLVDLPGYGYAKVSKKMQYQWQELIATYLESRECLRCVVVIVDMRHPAKLADMQLVEWLRSRTIPFLLVYTKSDKLSKNQQMKMVRALDAEFKVTEADRLLFSSKTGAGRDSLVTALDRFVSIL